MTELRTAHTADLAGATRDAVRALLDAAFDHDFSEADWDHTLGGMHVTVWRGHASAIMAALERFVRGGYELGALSATGQSASLYADRDWRRWQGGPAGPLAPRYGRVEVGRVLRTC